MAAKTEPLKGIGFLKDQIRQEIASTILSVKENFICLSGGRGIGKTYTVQKVVIDYCYQNDVEFQLVVETKDAMDNAALRKWLEKVTDIEFKKYFFRYTTEYVFMRKSEADDWKRIGVCVPLTKATANKRNSYPKCRFIIMDEAILADDQYKAYYMDWFLTIYHTADRDENVIKAILLGNTMQKINPIYEFFEVSTQDLKKPGIEVRSVNKYFWYIPMPPDLEEEKDNIFRQMIKGTKYGEMANGLFDTTYGYLIKDLPEDKTAFQDYGIYLGDDSCCQIIECEDGIAYAEPVEEEHMKRYCNPIFTTIYKNATEEYTIMPVWFLEYIKRGLSNGTLKFVDENSLLVLSSKFRQYLRINVI